MMRTKHTFDYSLFQKKIQIGGVEDIEFQEVLRKERAEVRGSSKKEVDFPGVIKKNLCGFSIGIGFLVL